MDNLTMLLILFLIGVAVGGVIVLDIIRNVLNVSHRIEYPAYRRDYDHQRSGGFLFGLLCMAAILFLFWFFADEKDNMPLPPDNSLQDSTEHVVKTNTSEYTVFTPDSIYQPSHKEPILENVEHFFIQANAFNNYDNAIAEVNYWSTKVNHTVKIATPNPGDKFHYKVVIGPFTDRKTATYYMRYYNIHGFIYTCTTSTYFEEI